MFKTIAKGSLGDTLNFRQVASSYFCLVIFAFSLKMGFIKAVSLLFLTFLVSTCGNNSTLVPKRKGYFRIGLPEKQYTAYQGDCPFTFEHPRYSWVVKDTGINAEPCWLNLLFPEFHSNLYLTYASLHNNLPLYTEDCRKFAVSHEIKASAITEREIVNDSNRIFGLIYDIEGDAASNLEFYLTDSVHHFIRGALYFYAVPNKDSLAPVLTFIKQDIFHLIKTFRWAETINTSDHP